MVKGHIIHFNTGIQNLCIWNIESRCFLASHFISHYISLPFRGCWFKSSHWAMLSVKNKGESKEWTDEFLLKCHTTLAIGSFGSFVRLLCRSSDAHFADSRTQWRGWRGSITLLEAAVMVATREWQNHHEGQLSLAALKNWYNMSVDARGINVELLSGGVIESISIFNTDVNILWPSHTFTPWTNIHCSVEHVYWVEGEACCFEQC